jgi:hypothetical protein
MFNKYSFLKEFKTTTLEEDLLALLKFLLIVKNYKIDFMDLETSPYFCIVYDWKINRQEEANRRNLLQKNGVISVNLNEDLKIEITEKGEKLINDILEILNIKLSDVEYKKYIRNR